MSIDRRLLIAEPAKARHQSTITDNRAGAAGALGIEVVRTAPPGGCTLLIEWQRDRAGRCAGRVMVLRA